MTYYTMMEELCEYYGQPKWDDPGAGVENKRTGRADKWVMQNIPEVELDRYLTRVFEQFRPTSEFPFPTVYHLKNIRLDMLSGRLPKYNPEYKQLENDCKIDNSKTVKNAVIKDLIMDDNVLGTKEMLIKYGIEQCGKLWRTKGEYCFDNDIDTKIMYSMKFDVKKLENYMGAK